MILIIFILPALYYHPYRLTKPTPTHKRYWPRNESMQKQGYSERWIRRQSKWNELF